MLQTIEKQLKDLLKKVGTTGEIEFSKPPNSEMGDVAFACFGLGENPKEEAEIIVDRIKRLEDCKIIGEVKAFGPYVNFYLRTCELANLVLDEVNKKDYGHNNIGKGKKVLIEYPSQNTHKEFHIGHFRNVCIGNPLVQLYRKSGYNIIPMNYVNDFGRHVVKALWWILRSQKSIKSVKSLKSGVNNQKWLGEMYAEASKYIEDHSVETKNFASAEIKSELDELQTKLEARDPEVMKIFEETKNWSVEGFKKLMDEFKTEHDSIIYESEVKDRGQEIVDELLKKKIAEVGEGGAIIINLEKYNLDIVLLRKSMGGGVYLTSDLALAEKKFKKYKVDESINITGTEQNHYFKQLFKVLELNGFKHKMTHIGYGLVNLPSGKMSSRAGNVILYEDLRDEVFASLKKETTDRHSDWSKEQVEKTVYVLTQAVLKFTMQKHESNKNITFDIKEAMSFEGYSAPYILYAVARINSLLRKSDNSYPSNSAGGQITDNNFSLLDKPEEKVLLMLLGEYGEVVKKALENYNPSTIARYCFDLAQAFNDFYNKHSVLNIEDEELRKARLALSEAVRKVLVDALRLLTIETVDAM